MAMDWTMMRKAAIALAALGTVSPIAAAFHGH
jgi:hypothetical protein